MDKNGKDRSRIQLIGIFMTIPFILTVPPIIGWYMGSWLDHFFGTRYLFIFIFILLGLIAAIREFFRLLKKYGNGNLL